MPTYEYVCAGCGRRIDVMHGIHAHGPTTCEACGGTMRKALSTPAIHFKGSGWAKNDARASSRSSSTTEGKAAGGSGAAGATDTGGSTGSGGPDASTGTAGAAGTSPGASGASGSSASGPASETPSSGRG